MPLLEAVRRAAVRLPEVPNNLIFHARLALLGPFSCHLLFSTLNPCNPFWNFECLIGGPLSVINLSHMTRNIPPVVWYFLRAVRQSLYNQSGTSGSPPPEPIVGNRKTCLRVFEVLEPFGTQCTWLPLA